MQIMHFKPMLDKEDGCYFLKERDFPSIPLRPHREM